jgi:hypothetical protein
LVGCVGVVTRFDASARTAYPEAGNLSLAFALRHDARLDANLRIRRHGGEDPARINPKTVMRRKSLNDDD